MSATAVRAPMPGERLSRERGWTLGAAGLVALMITIAWWSIEASSVPNGDLARRGWDVAVDGPWPFPHEQVRIWLTVMGVEGALAVWVLSARLPLSLAARSLSLGIVTFLLFLFHLLQAMHASAPFQQHLAWLLYATGWLLAFSVAAAVCAWAARRLRARRARRAYRATAAPR